MALVLEGQLQEGIRELDTVQNYTEVGSLVDILFIYPLVYLWQTFFLNHTSQSS